MGQTNIARIALQSSPQMFPPIYV